MLSGCVERVERGKEKRQKTEGRRFDARFPTLIYSYFTLRRFLVYSSIVGDDNVQARHHYGRILAVMRASCVL